MVIKGFLKNLESEFVKPAVCSYSSGVRDRQLPPRPTDGGAQRAGQAADGEGAAGRLVAHLRKQAGNDVKVFIVVPVNLTLSRLGNKPLHPYAPLASQDVPGAVSVEEMTELLSLHKLCCGRSWHIQGCDARSGMGLHEGLDWLSRQLVAAGVLDVA